MRDLIFNRIKVACPDCRNFVAASIEDLQFDEELICPKCNFQFTPNVDAESLIKLIHQAEAATAELE